MKKIVLLLLITVSGFQYCTSTKKIAVKESPEVAAVTYAGHIQPLVVANCSPCHFPPKGFKKALDSYTAVKGEISDIIRRIQMNPGERDFMPFKHAKLSDSVINVFVQWQNKGLKE